nr:T9SS type A sorting domain-containing protein [Candidatus Neomarinimicrobiota bacterium]
WTELVKGTGQQTVFIDFIDVNTGYVIGYYGMFMKTTDAGASFTPLLEWPQLSFWGMAMPEANKIVLTANAGGEMTISVDGGLTWDYPNNYATGARDAIYECEFLDANNGLIAGSNGFIGKTVDGGSIWTPVDNPFVAENRAFNSLRYFNADTIFAGGYSGRICQSIDGGVNWVMTDYGSGSVYDIFLVGGSKVIATAGSGQYLYSDNYGATFTMVDWGSLSYRAVEERSGVIIVPASSGHLFRTTLAEYDTLYEVFTDPDGDDLYDVEFINDTLVYVVGEAGKIYKSEDAGLTWNAEVNSSTETLQKVRFQNGRLWAVGQGGTILMNEIGTPVLPVLAGEYYIPKGVNAQGFESLGEAIKCLNGMDVSGTVTFLLDADTLREESFTFNADLSAENNVIVKPASGRDVVLIVAPGVSKGNGPQMIGFDKGYVTFDGSNDGSDSRNLIITNELYADVPLGLNTADADMIVLKNLIIKNLDNGIKNFKYGPITNDVAGIEGFTVENCQIGSAEFPVWRDGVAVWGSSSAPTQGIVLNNEIYAGCRGITTYVVNDCNFSGNTIHMLPTTSATTYSYVHGIYLTGASGPTTIHGNTINCLEAATVSGTYVVGIAFAGNSEGEGEIISVVNNMVNVGATAGTHPTYGIGFRSANNMGNIQAYHNTILLNNLASTSACHAVGNHTNGTGPVTLELLNNIIINNHTGNSGSSAIGLIPTASVLTSDYNLLVSNQNFVNYTGTSYADLTAWQVAGQDANSVSKPVEFVSATDLHLVGASIGDINLVGTPLATVTTDIDGDARSTTLPYKGADESDEIVLSIDQNVDILPESFKLHQNYPNPFNPTTTISFDLPEAANVQLVIYNMMGQQVAELKNENMQPGFYKMNFNASHLASGVYIYRIQANNFAAIKKMTILK